MKKTIWIIVVVFLLGALVGGYLVWKRSVNQTNSLTTFDGHYIDAHAHLITDRFDLGEASDILKKSKIDKMIIMQTPVDLSHIATPESHGIPQAAETYPDQFAVMYQGDALVMLHKAVKKGSYTNEEQAQFLSLAEEAAKSDKYVGFGELALRHYAQPNITDPVQKEARDITIAGDHPWMLILSDLGAKYNMPLDVHIEPDSSTLPGFEKLIAHNPNTKIIFDHAGWYNTGEATAELFDQLMSKYANLYATIKLRKPANKNQQKEAILDKSGEIKQEWLDVFARFPDRFMIGTDVKFGLDTTEGNYEEILKMTNKFLSNLSADLAPKIAIENAIKVYSLK